MRILLTEDDQDLAKITARNLKKEGVAVDIALSGQEAICLLEGNGEYDAAVLDLRLPDINGINLLKIFKSTAPTMPVLALTAKDTEEDKIKGIKLGLDDYMTKPFSYQELAARLRVLYRWQPDRIEKTIKIKSLEVNPQTQTTMVAGHSVKLTLNESRVLYFLAKNKNRTVPASKLLSEIWDNNGTGDIAKVFTTISRLRKKIDNKRHKIIKTENRGYIVS